MPKAIVRRRLAPVLSALLFTLTMSGAVARDLGQYEHVDPFIRGWFKALKQPGTSVSCCDESDCKRTEERIEGDHYRAQAPDGSWIDVPEERIVRSLGNPTGEPILCAMPTVTGGVSWRVLCFVPGAGL